MSIIHVCEQGSESWHLARAAKITASRFVDIRTRLKTGKNAGDFSAAAKSYAFRVAVERISGVPLDEGFQTKQMARGNDLEPEARAEFELKTGLFVDRCGFVETDCGKFGASADGLIDNDGGLEIKCLMDPDRIKQVLLTGDISEFTDQVQGCMWICERDWWEFVLYVPALKSINKHLFIRHVKRDDAYIDAMQAELYEFDRLVAANEEALRNLKSEGMSNV